MVWSGGTRARVWAEVGACGRFRCRWIKTHRYRYSTNAPRRYDEPQAAFAIPLGTQPPQLHACSTHPAPSLPRISFPPSPPPPTRQDVVAHAGDAVPVQQPEARRHRLLAGQRQRRHDAVGGAVGVPGGGGGGGRGWGYTIRGWGWVDGMMEG